MQLKAGEVEVDRALEVRSGAVVVVAAGRKPVVPSHSNRELIPFPNVYYYRQ